MITSPVNITAVGGGKGGIGKSIVCANLAIGMALSGQHVILMDTDFGASNLHALLGIGNPPHGFNDLFSPETVNPHDLLLDTGISNLKFLSGAGAEPGSANLVPDKVDAIISLVHKLEADSIILDLGPGAYHNVTDFFNLSTQSVVLTTPDVTSVMNTFSFLRAALFRKLYRKFEGYPEIQRLLDHSNPPREDAETHTIGLLKEKLDKIAPDQVAKVESAVKSFKSGLVINRVRSSKDLSVGDHLTHLARKHLEIDLEYYGHIIESDRVRDSVDEMIPFLIKDPQSKPSENLQHIIGALTQTDLQLVKKDGNIMVSKQVRLTSRWGA